MLPQGFRTLMEGLGLSDLPAALESGEPTVSVRVNAAKGGADFPGAEPVAWCREGVYLPERPNFTLDPRLHQGRYYVQEAASMFHAHVARQLVADAPMRVLDACAAPGGKTTAVIPVLPAGSAVVANEYVPARAAVLRENIVKWGYPGAIVTRGDTAGLRKLKGEFDLIIADVPCSGEGMMRKDPQASAQWNPGLVNECADRQRDILGNLWPTLRPGGHLVYSTCTFNRSEDEEIIDWLIDEYGAESVEIPTEPEWNITPGIGTGAHCCRFIPGRTRGEGLFVAVVRKPGEPSAPKPRKDKQREKPSAFSTQVKDWILPDTDMEMTVYQQDDRLTAFPKAHLDLLKKVSAQVDVIHEGVPLATVKGRDLIPAHALAMSTRLNREAFPQAELGLDAALDYLRGSAIVLPEGTPKGYVIVYYDGCPLGWVKNLGNRSNNLYPTPYRIKNL